MVFIWRAYLQVRRLLVQVHGLQLSFIFGKCALARTRCWPVAQPDGLYRANTTDDLSPFSYTFRKAEHDTTAPPRRLSLGRFSALASAPCGSHSLIGSLMNATDTQNRGVNWATKSTTTSVKHVSGLCQTFNATATRTAKMASNSMEQDRFESLWMCTST